MKAIKAKIVRGLQRRSCVATCDNSGARILRVITFIGLKGVKGRHLSGGVGDLMVASVIDGVPDMRKKVVRAVVVRQRKEYRRLDGTRIKFEDNAAVVLKDDKGNPKGTLLKGPVAREITVRWPAVAKLAKIIV